jgi:CHASE2 domain-containing sensor protein
MPGLGRGGRLNVFISYRRRESAGHSGRIYDRLQALLPDADVFIDVVDIEPGADWRERLAGRIAEADVVLVLIGSEWRSAADAAGRRRIDDPHDVTRWEIETAAAHGKHIVPVLLDDAEPLRPEELPDTLQPLARLQAARIRHDAFDAGLDDLVARLTGRRLRDEVARARSRLRLERGARWSVPAIALLAVLLAWTRLFDLLTLDTRIATWTLALADAAAPLPLDPDLVLVGIDTTHDAGDPAMRARYGEAISALAAAGARRIVLDVHFHEARAGDSVLADAIRMAGSRGTEVFFSFVDLRAGAARAVPQLASAASGLGLACIGRRLGYARTVALAFDVRRDAQGWRASPLPSLAVLGAAGRARVAAIDPDERSISLQAEGKALHYRYSSTSSEIAGAQSCPAMTPGTRVAELLVRLPPPEVLRARRVRLADVLSGPAEPKRFAGKTVVMGFETPGESFGIAHGLHRARVYGYELHAAAINVLESGRTPAFASPAAQAALAGALASLGVALGVRFRRLGGLAALGLLLTVAIAYLAVAVAIAAGEDRLLNGAYDLTAFGLAFALFRAMARRWLQ